MRRSSWRFFLLKEGATVTTCHLRKEGGGAFLFSCLYGRHLPFTEHFWAAVCYCPRTCWEQALHVNVPVAGPPVYG